MRLMRAALALLPLLLFTAFAPSAPAAGLAFVINSGGASISLVDMATQKELRRIPALREPHHWALTPDGKSLLIGDTVGNELMFLDPATGAVQRRMPCVDPYQLGFSPDGRFFVVNGLARNQIDVYDGATLQLLKRFPIKAMPSHLAYSPDSTKVYVSLQETDRLVAIDLKKLDILWNEQVGKTPAGVLWLHGKLLVCLMGSDEVVEVDPLTGGIGRRVRTGAGAPAPDKVEYVQVPAKVREAAHSPADYDGHAIGRQRAGLHENLGQRGAHEGQVVKTEPCRHATWP